MNHNDINNIQVATLSDSLVRLHTVVIRATSTHCPCHRSDCEALISVGTLARHSRNASAPCVHCCVLPKNIHSLQISHHSGRTSTPLDVLGTFFSKQHLLHLRRWVRGVPLGALTISTLLLDQGTPLTRRGSLHNTQAGTFPCVTQTNKQTLRRPSADQRYARERCKVRTLQQLDLNPNLIYSRRRLYYTFELATVSLSSEKEGCFHKKEGSRKLMVCSVGKGRRSAG